MITPLFPALPYASSNFAIDSATDALGAIFVAQKSGTIDRLFYNCNVNTSPPSYLIRLESLSAGRPSNTILSAGASATFTPANLNVNAVALGTSYNVTAGEVFAVTISHNSGTIGGSNFSTFNYVVTCYPALMYSNNGASWIQGSTAYSTWSTGISNPGLAGFGALYSDNEIVGTGWPMAASTVNTSVPTSGTDSYYGNVFTAPANLICNGFLANGRFDGSATIYLYDSNNNQLASYAIASGAYPATTNVHAIGWFSSPVNLIKGQSYRIFARNSSGTVQFSSSRCDLSTYTPTMITGGAKSTTSTNGTSWTDDTARFAAITPLVDFPSYHMGHSPVQMSPNVWSL